MGKNDSISNKVRYHTNVEAYGRVTRKKHQIKWITRIITLWSLSYLDKRS